MIPFFDLSRLHAPLQSEFTAAFERVMGHGRFILGSEVTDFEAAFAQRVGVSHAIGMSSGTDALLAALMALDIGPGDEVIVPTFTFFATAGAVVRVGATPIFADVDPDTFLIDVEDALALRSKRTRAIIVVHLFGQCAEVAAFQRAGLTVIEDAAQAQGATDVAGVAAGAQGDLACFSFFPTKPLGGMGDGGAVTTADDALADSLKLIRGHGARPKFHHVRIGGNFRLDALQAALLSVKLPHLDGWVRDRQTIALGYRERLSAVVERGDLTFLREVGGRHVYHQHVVRVRRRDPLRRALSDAGIGTALYYPEPLHIQPCFAPLGKPRSLPTSEQACAEGVALPCYPGLTAAELDTICAAIGGFYGR